MSAAPDLGTEADFSDLGWFLSMPLCRASVLPFGIVHLRRQCATHGALLSSRVSRAELPREAPHLFAVFRHSLAALEDIARLQADGVCMADRERLAVARAETERQQLARALGLTDTRAFHGARPDPHGFPYYPAAPVLVGRGKRPAKRNPQGGGTPPEVA